MNTPAVDPGLIPHSWFMWAHVSIVLALFLSILITVIATARGLQPFRPQEPKTPPAAPVWDGYQWQSGATVTEVRPTTLATVTAHPFVMFVMWLFGSYLGLFILFEVAAGMWSFVSFIGHHV